MAWLLCTLALAVGARPAQSQQFTVQGQVVDTAGRAGVSGISVTLTGKPTLITDERGRFRFMNVDRGRYVLTAQALGYATAETALVVRADTTVRIELKLAPVSIDPLEVRGGHVAITGIVSERASRAWLIDADVFVSPEYRTKPNPVGRFRLGRVPTGIPLDVRVQLFGYLPAHVTFTPQRNTTLNIELMEDSVALRMIAAQLERLDARSEGRRYEGLPVLDRRDLLKDLNVSGSIKEVLEHRLGEAMYRRVACVVIDDSPLFRRNFATMLPDRIERVEILEVPDMRRRLIVRVYTRDFAQQMVRGQATLVSRDQVLAHYVSPAMCR